MSNPLLIQGGMGVGVSNWRLANAVSSAGQLGVISGTCLDGVLMRRLQDGDPGGHMRRALAEFPFRDTARNILEKYFVPGGIKKRHHYARSPKFTTKNNNFLNALTVVANFTETWLAKENHTGFVGVNYLEKIQLPTLSSLYGALLAGIDYVIVGAGIPLEFPGILSKLAKNLPAALRLNVENTEKEESFFSHFDPASLFGKKLPSLRLPKFLPIVSSNLLANLMTKKASGPVDGLIFESHDAGGHNAPPRGKMQLDETGEPIYGDRDRINTEKLKDLGIPFWMAGSYGEPEQLEAALAAGAAGIQVGSPFALCKESGIFPDLKNRIREVVRRGISQVSTDANASPTGFPFKVMRMLDTLSESALFERRKKVCNMGYLRQLYKKEDGSIGYRCPAENSEAYRNKEGVIDDGTSGKRCLCNALFATIGMPSEYEDGYTEKAIVTIGSRLENVRNLLKQRADFTARDVINYILKVK